MTDYNNITLNIEIPWTWDGFGSIDLPAEFKHYPDSEWHIGLEKFDCVFDASQTASNIIIYIDQLNSTTISAKNFNTSNVLAIVPTNEVSYEPNLIKYHKLHSDIFDRLDFQLVCDDGEPIKFRHRQCYMRLRITNMSTDEDEFMLRLRCQNLNGPTTSYKFNLNHPIYFSRGGTWKMAIESILYPPVNMHDETLKLKVDYKGRQANISIPTHIIRDSATFLKKVKAELNKTIPPESYKMIISKINNNRLIINWNDDKPMRMSYNRDIAYMMGNSKRGYNYAKTEHTFKKLDPFAFDEPFDVDRTQPKFMKVYSDITTSVAVNSRFEPLIAILPIEGEKQLIYQPKRLDYIPIEKTVIEEITFNFKDIHDNPIPFVPPHYRTRGQIFMNVHFKKFK